MASLHRWLLFFRAFRLAEVCTLTGFFLAGIWFIPNWQQLWRLPAMYLYILSSFFFVLSVYAMNAWQGFGGDQWNPRLYAGQQLHRRYFLHMFGLASFISLGILLYAFPRVIYLQLPALGLWYLYGHPRFGLKHIPLAGTALHLAAQVLHTCMAYVAFCDGWPPGWVLTGGVAWGLLFAGGHLFHEAKDKDADLRAGSFTLAAWIGSRHVVRIGMGLFVLSAGVFMLLAAQHTSLMPLARAHLCALCIIMAGFGVATFKGFPPHLHTRQFSWFYRLVYVLVLGSMAFRQLF
ncbi:MAG: UbiA family prenyltransferase [Bacteroidetes bacterium]|nr:UbiA family prenyltransferase [Bacteroidota bacterium]